MYIQFIHLSFLANFDEAHKASILGEQDSDFETLPTILNSTKRSRRGKNQVKSRSDDDSNVSPSPPKK